MEFFYSEKNVDLLFTRNNIRVNNMQF